MDKIIGGVQDFFGGIYSYFLTFVLLFSSVFSFFGIVEKPEIKQAEFDFEVVYEIDGEIKTIEGTYVCKFEKVINIYTTIFDNVCGKIKILLLFGKVI